MHKLAAEGLAALTVDEACNLVAQLGFGHFVESLKAAAVRRVLSCAERCLPPSPTIQFHKRTSIYSCKYTTKTHASAHTVFRGDKAHIVHLNLKGGRKRSCRSRQLVRGYPRDRSRRHSGSMQSLHQTTERCRNCGQYERRGWSTGLLFTNPNAVRRLTQLLCTHLSLGFR